MDNNEILNNIKNNKDTVIQIDTLHHSNKGYSKSIWKNDEVIYFLLPKTIRKTIFFADYQLNTLKQIYRSYKKRAIKKKFEFTITFIDFIFFANGSCHYCGKRLVNQKTNPPDSSNFDVKYNGIDRKDNDIGYTPENSVSCCGICNKAKGSISYKNFKNWLTAIKNNEG